MVAIAEAAAVAGAPDLQQASSDQLAKAWGLVCETAGITAGELARSIAEEANIGVAGIPPADPSVTAVLPASVARRRNVVPIACTVTDITVASGIPLNEQARREIAGLTGRTVVVEIAPPELITGAIHTGYGPARGDEEDAPVELSPAADGPRVLVVDDEAGQRTLFRSVLEEAGYRVDLAVDGPAAVERLAADPDYDVVTLDYWMDRMNGLRVLQHVRNDPRTAAIPVIMVTGSNDRRIEMSLFEAGADDYVAKPIDAPLFLLRVQAVLRRQQFKR